MFMRGFADSGGLYMGSGGTDAGFASIHTGNIEIHDVSVES